MKVSVGLIAAAAVFVLVIAVIFYLVYKIRRISMDFFGTKSLTEGWKRQAQELAATPKSVAGMTRLLAPQIQRDFPEFNWREFQNKAENRMKGFLTALDREDISYLKEGSEELQRQLELQISRNQAQKIREHYKDIQIYNTEITKYEKDRGTCVITLQSAVGHLHYKTREGEVIEGDDKLLEQTRYNMEILYVQDEELANSDHGVGITCPHCGAPVTGLGVKQCEYCGGVVTPVNRQVWSFHKFYEVDYHSVS
ncbi:MAG: TIM44-like domain-containing protein [Lachnospiraceae bacterium]|nr:TIM44-like domain-containing protein [Lachnospiraceae bacterium]